MIENTQARAHDNRLAINIIDSATTEDLAPESVAFNQGANIPDKFAAEHENLSPPLQWQSGPRQTRSYAVIAQDPDAPQDTPFVHWLLYNLPSDITQLEGGVSNGSTPDDTKGAYEGTNDRNFHGYFGPRPPQGDEPHRYYFQVFALDTELELGEGASAAELIDAMRGHALAKGSCVGTYQRP